MEQTGVSGKKEHTEGLDISVNDTGRFYGGGCCGYCRGNFKGKDKFAEFLSVYDGAVKGIVTRPFHPACGKEVPNLEALAEIERKVSELEALSCKVIQQEEVAEYFHSRYAGTTGKFELLAATFIPFVPLILYDSNVCEVQKKTGINIKDRATSETLGVGDMGVLWGMVFAAATLSPVEAFAVLYTSSCIFRLIGCLALPKFNYDFFLEQMAKSKNEISELKARASELEKALYPEGKVIEKE